MAATTARETDRSRLSRAAVVERALAISDADGLEAVTIRRLAAELGVTPMALYWHFRGKDELLAGLADRLWAQVDARVDAAAPWPAQIRSLLESLVRMLREHPSAPALLLASEPLASQAALDATEAALEVLNRAGFDPAQAAAITRNALHAGLMLAMSDPGRVPGVTDAECAEMQRRQRIRLALLPPDRYPRVVAAADPLTSCEPDQHYRLGIDLFIAGVQALAPAAGRRPGQAGPGQSAGR